MRILSALFLFAGVSAAHAQDIAPSYAQPGYSGRVGTVVTLCPSADGSKTTVACGTPGAPTAVTVIPFRDLLANSDSGAITVGGSWQMVAPANPQRQRLLVQNYCQSSTQGVTTTESLFLAHSVAMPTYSPLVTPGAVELVTCGTYDTSEAVVSTAAVWLWAATTGHRFLAAEW